MFVKVVNIENLLSSSAIESALYRKAVSFAKAGISPLTNIMKRIAPSTDP